MEFAVVSADVEATVNVNAGSAVLVGGRVDVDNRVATVCAFVLVIIFLVVLTLFNGSTGIALAGGFERGVEFT
jgi:hypothetical protein